MQKLGLKRAALGGGAVLLLAGVALVGVVGAQQPTTPTSQRPCGFGAAGHGFLNGGGGRPGFSGFLAGQAQPTPEGGSPRHHGFGNRGGAPFAGLLNVAAQALGISVDQLCHELAGSTLADVARAHNVAPDVVANALKAEAAARINTMIDNLMTHQIPGRAVWRPTPTPTAAPTR